MIIGALMFDDVTKALNEADDLPKGESWKSKAKTFAGIIGFGTAIFSMIFTTVSIMGATIGEEHASTAGTLSTFTAILSIIFDLISFSSVGPGLYLGMLGLGLSAFSLAGPYFFG